MKNYNYNLTETTCLTPMCRYCKICVLSEANKKRFIISKETLLNSHNFLDPSLATKIIETGYNHGICAALVCQSFEEAKTSSDYVKLPG